MRHIHKQVKNFVVDDKREIYGLCHILNLCSDVINRSSSRGKGRVTLPFPIFRKEVAEWELIWRSQESVSEIGSEETRTKNHLGNFWELRRWWNATSESDRIVRSLVN